jgi:hypothetical protein
MLIQIISLVLGVSVKSRSEPTLFPFVNHLLQNFVYSQLDPCLILFCGDNDVVMMCLIGWKRNHCEHQFHFPFLVVPPF